MTGDPLHRLVFQPIVDRAGIQPGPAAMQALNVFLLVTVTLSGVRMATLDPQTHPGLWFWQTMQVVGALVVYAWVRFVIANGAVARTGMLGAAHLLMRGVMLGCLVIDALELRTLLTTDLIVEPVSLARSAMQFLQDASLLCALYLSLCDRPPPRHRPQPRRMATI